MLRARDRALSALFETEKKETARDHHFWAAGLVLECKTMSGSGDEQTLVDNCRAGRRLPDRRSPYAVRLQRTDCDFDFIEMGTN